MPTPTSTHPSPSSERALTPTTPGSHPISTTPPQPTPSPRPAPACRFAAARRLLISARRRHPRNVRPAASDRGAITAEYAVLIVGACGLGGVLVALLRSPATQEMLKKIINFGLSLAGVEGVQI